MPAEQIVTSTDWKARTGELLDQLLGGDRILITRHGRTVAAVVSLADLEALRELDRINSSRQPGKR